MDVSSLIAEAFQRLEAGDDAGAIATLNQVIEAEPTHAEALFYRAQLLAQAGEVAPALADLDQVLALSPAMMAARQWRAETRVDAGDFAGAIVDYTDLLASPGLTHEQRFDYLAHRGQLYTATEAYDAAIADYDAALALEPEFFTLLPLRAAARWRAGDHAGALADVREGLGRYPEDAEAWLQLARMLRALGEHDEARHALDQALAWDPELDEAIAEASGES